MTETYVKEEVARRTMVKVPLSNSFVERSDARRKFSGSHLDPKMTGNSRSGAVRAGKRRA